MPFKRADNWFEALGGIVGEGGIEEALYLCDSWGLNKTESILCIEQAVRYIEKDQPERAIGQIEALVGRSNQTAVFMLLATLASHTIAQF